MSIIEMVPIIKTVQDLQLETINQIKSCQEIKSIKLLCEVHEVLYMTNIINMKYNNPVKKNLVYDECAFKAMRNNLSSVFIYNDPDRFVIRPYMDKVKKLIHYYRNWKRYD